MEYQEIDEWTTDSIWEDEIVETGEDGEETTPNKNKNKSNFNSLYKKTKELESLNSSKDEELANLKASLKEWEELNPEIEDEKKSNREVDSLKVSIFTLKNPESEPHLKEIQSVMREYNIDISKAWKLVKVDLPEESTTTTDFNISKNTWISKNLSKVSAEDALKLSPEKQREWRNIHLG